LRAPAGVLSERAALLLPKPRGGLRITALTASRWTRCSPWTRKAAAGALRQPAHGL